jgi:hypothetical protein
MSKSLWECSLTNSRLCSASRELRASDSSINWIWLGELIPCKKYTSKLLKITLSEIEIKGES